MNLLTSSTDQEFTKTATALLARNMQSAITERGFCIVGFSGGSTPKPIYEALGKEKGIDWSKVWIFLVDDRSVRADDPNSNQFLLRSTLLKTAAIPESQILFPDTTLPINECIDLYDDHLRDLLNKGVPDVVTLGLGDDGHIASLFPPLSDAAFGPNLAIHTTTEKFAIHDRISVTFPVLTHAKHSIFFLKGKAKKEVWEKMMENEENETQWPAKLILEKTETTVIAQW